MATNSMFDDVLMGYRPRSAWDELSPEERQLAGDNPFQDPLGAELRQTMGLPGWRSQPVDYITPDQQDTVLSSLAGGAATAAGAVGGFLDKYTGSRAVRGIAGNVLNALDPGQGHKGNWREALSFLPLSDYFGVTNPQDAVSGKDVFGIKDDPTKWSDDIKGIAAEVLMDPTFFVGGFLKGGLTAGGKALKSAGALRDVDWALQNLGRAAGSKAGKLVTRGSKTLEEGLAALPNRSFADKIMGNLGDAAGNPSVLSQWLSEPIGTSLDVGLPFSEKVRSGFNLPKKVDQFRDWAMDFAGGNALSRAVINQLHAPAKGMTTKLGQNLAKQVSYVQGRTPEFMEQIVGEASRLKEAGEFTPQKAMELYSELEGFVQNPSRTPTHDMADYIRNDIARRRKELGLGPALKDEYAEYATRYGIRGEDRAGFKAHEFAPVLDAGGKDMARSAALKNIRGGTASIMEMMMDDDIIIPSKLRKYKAPLESALITKYGHLLPNHAQGSEAMNELLNIFHSAPEDVMRRGFFMHPLEAQFNYIRKFADKEAISTAQIDLMAHGQPDAAAIEAKLVAAGAKPDAIKKELASFSEMFNRKPVDDAWVPGSRMSSFLGFSKNAAEAASTQADNPLHGGAYVEYIKRYGDDAQKQEVANLAGLWDDAVARGDEAAFTNAQDKIGDFVKDFGENTRVPRQIMEDVMHWDNLFQPGKQIGNLTKFVDKFTNLFKAGVLTWPARYTRDLVSGQVQNMMLNQWAPRAAGDALQYISKGAVKDPRRYLTHLPQAQLAAMTDAEAARAFNAHIASLGFLGQQHTPMAQVGNLAAPSGLESVLNSIPTGQGNPLQAAAAELKGLGTKEGLNPFNIRGVRGEETKFALAKSGDVLGKASDNLNRLVPYLTLKARGVATDEALRRVMSSQVDYATKTLTQTERQILSRVFPFWRYSSKMLPFVFQEVLDRPGGAMAQAIRMQGRSGSGENQFVPSHIRQSFALPLSGYLGSKDPQRQRFLTGLGLMHEDPLSMFQPGPDWTGTAKNLLKDVGGRMNPLGKVPLELAFGRQLYSGRDLLDLDSNIGRIISNLGITKEPPKISPLLDQVVSGSPISRALTSLRVATDPSKGMGARALNLLTGARVSDVDMDKARNIAINELIEGKLRGKEGVRTLRPHMYVKAEDRPKLDPMDLMLLDVYRQRLANAKRAAVAKTRLDPLGKAILSERISPELETDARLL